MSSNSSSYSSSSSAAERFVGYYESFEKHPIGQLFADKNPNNGGEFKPIMATLINQCRDNPIPNFDLVILERNVQECYDRALAKKREGILLVQDFSVSEIAALYLYSTHSDFYSTLNAILRESDIILLWPFVDIIWLILLGLSKCPVYTDRDTVYRGVKKDLSATLQKNASVTWYAFTSCSTELGTLQDDQFMGNGLANPEHRSNVAICMTTTRARNIAPLSSHPEEKEVLFPPNTKFTVISSAYLGNNLTQYLLREEPPEDPILHYGETKFQDYIAKWRFYGSSGNTTTSPNTSTAPISPAAMDPQHSSGVRLLCSDFEFN
jgi:hypothetical protein